MQVSQQTCVDPESFVRVGPTLKRVFLGVRTSITRKPYKFVIFQGWGGGWGGGGLHRLSNPLLWIPTWQTTTVLKKNVVNGRIMVSSRRNIITAITGLLQAKMLG